MEEMNEELVSALISGGKAWVVLTIAAAMPTLWAMTLIFQFARPYIWRVLRGLTLRFGADVWWLSYVLIRDAVLLATFAIGLVLLSPGLYLTMSLPLFAPFASLLLFWALVVKLFGEADDDPRTFRAVSLLVVAAATLFFSGLFFGVEATDQAYLGSLPSFLVSATNPDWAGPILVLGLAGHAITGLYIFGRFVAGLREPAEQREEGFTGQPG